MLPLAPIDTLSVPEIKQSEHIFLVDQTDAFDRETIRNVGQVKSVSLVLSEDVRVEDGVVERALY